MILLLLILVLGGCAPTLIPPPYHCVTQRAKDAPDTLVTYCEPVTD